MIKEHRIEVYEDKEELQKQQDLLTKQQKKKYKWQYLRAYFRAFIVTALILSGIVNAMNMAFAQKGSFAFYSSCAILFTIFTVEYLLGIKEEFELINERAEKRAIKNMVNKYKTEEKKR